MNNLLHSMLGQAEVVSGSTIQALKQYLPQPAGANPYPEVTQQYKPARVTSGNKNQLKVRRNG